MARADAILETVERIHEAALTPSGWTSALSSIAAAVNGQRSFLVVQDTTSGAAQAVLGTGMTAEQLSRLCSTQGLGDLPPWAGVLPCGVIVKTSAMMPDREFARSSFYNESIKPMGDFYGLVATLPAADRKRAFLAIGRAMGRDDYDADDIKVFHILLQHLQSALRISRKLEGADLREKAACAALFQLDTATIIVDENAKIIFVNRAAEDILNHNDCLYIDRGGLHISYPLISARLHAAIAACTSSDASNASMAGIELTIPRSPKRQPLRVMVSPLRTDTADFSLLGAARTVAVLMITDPEKEYQNRMNELRARFGLTQSEAAVSLEISRGDGREAVAQRLGITVATVKTHLIHVFEKTGVRHQAELVHLVLHL